jgi:hypothetical protein
MIKNMLERSLFLPHIKKACWSNWLTVSKDMSSERKVVIEVKVAKTGRLWKFGFCRDLSLDLGVLAYSTKKPLNTCTMPFRTQYLYHAFPVTTNENLPDKKRRGIVFKKMCGVLVKIDSIMLACLVCVVLKIVSLNMSGLCCGQICQFKHVGNVLWSGF